MQIGGKTKVCGLIGNPVEHTLSPLIHNHLAGAMGENLVYVPFLVENQNVEAAVKGAYALSITGLNVTVPHKSAVIPHLKELDPLAEKIGAVNTLVRTEGGYKGYNTDMTGLLRAMKSEGIQIEGKKTLLLGAGGASRAVAFMLGTEGAKQVYLLNRTVDRAFGVAKEVNEAMGREVIIPMSLSEYKTLPKEKYLCIQGTSVGLYPDSDRAVIEEPDFYELVDVAVDLIYKPADTRFMILSREAGAKAYNGLKMLLYQGVIAYELWNHVRVDESLCMEIYEKMKEAVKV